MITGGYKIIDLGNKNLTADVGMVFDGIYEAIESTRKTTLLSGLQIGGVEYNDAFVNFKVSGSNFVTEKPVYSYTITISDVDAVTATYTGSEPA